MNDKSGWTSPSSIGSADTQPSPRIVARAAAPRPIAPVAPRRPIGLYALTGCLAVIVLVCVTLTLVLAAIGPGTLLALRDRWLGQDLQATVSTIGQVAQVVVANTDVWPVPGNGRLTVLLMGVDTRDTDTEGAARSDVLTLVTIDPVSQTAALLSIPRDLYVPIPQLELDSRINTAYFYGDYYDLPGGGPALAKLTMAYNFGIQVDRYAVIDFAGFKQIVDAVGGVEVDVPFDIVDYAYPTEDYGVETLSIPAGRTHLDGELALKYVRTRHADSDFGRLERQQQVMLAIRDKALSIGNLGRVPETLNAVGDSLRTDFTLPEILTLAKKWSDIPRENIHTYRIDETMVQPWVTPQGGQVLLPIRDAIAPLVAQFLGQVPAVAANP